MNERYDILVAGGGPVGWSCALSCALALPRARIGVVDRAIPPTMPSGGLETRVYTVNEDNLAWLAANGVLLDETRMADVERIRVFDQAGMSALSVDTRDAKRARLAKVAEHDALTAAIAERAHALQVKFIEGEIKGTGILDQYRYLELADGSLLNTSLAIVAEGKHSGLRDALGLQTVHRDYERFGVVAHLVIESPHRGEARQWFLPDQTILALLPLPDRNGRACVSMVWSVPKSRADALRSMSADTLCATVSDATRLTVRAMEALTSAVAFPLKLARVADPVAERAVVVGDAAHAVHPLAGQGVNLGFGDAIALGNVLQAASAVNEDLGHALLLAKFRRTRYAAVLAMQAATDGLARIYNLESSLFTDSSIAPAAIGDFGMRLLGKLPAFRRFVSSAVR